MDFNDINNQLADLTRDWERHQDAQHQYNNPDQQRRNDLISAARQFIPPSTVPGDAVTHSSTQRYPVPPNYQSFAGHQSTPQAQQPSRPIYNPSQPQIIQTPPTQQPAYPQFYQQPPMQQQPSQVTAGHYQQLPEQVRLSDPNSDPRAAMNERMGNFRFDHAGSTYGMPGLVPVNMDHIYSGNLFSDGLPVPQDLRDQFTLSVPGQSQLGSRIQHQTKGKTMYRSDNNERLAALSPLGRALYYPVGGQFGDIPSYPQPQQPSAGLSPQPQSAGLSPQPQSAGLSPQQPSAGLSPQQPSAGLSPQQPSAGFLPHYQQQQIDYSSSGLARPQQAFNPALQPQMNTRRSELRADINARLGKIPSLSTASAPESQYINMGSELYGSRIHDPSSTQSKKVIYQDMYPVMSK